LLGHGTLLSGGEMLFGARAADLKFAVGSGDSGLTLALVPAGAFFVLALLVALRNALAGRRITRVTAGIRNPGASADS
jgi:electron transport complex protein RnfE